MESGDKNHMGKRSNKGVCVRVFECECGYVCTYVHACSLYVYMCMVFMCESMLYDFVCVVMCMYVHVCCVCISLCMHKCMCVHKWCIYLSMSVCVVFVCRKES